jgi:hypothetical protein
MDRSEHGRVGNLLTEYCPGHVISLWPDAPPDPPPPTAPPEPAPPSVQPAIPAAPAGNCHPSYPTVCIPPAPPDLDCRDVTARRFVVLPPDPHGFDGNGDGAGCES